MDKIKKSLTKVSEVELMVKKYPTNSTNIVTNFILEQTNNSLNNQILLYLLFYLADQYRDKRK